MQLEFHVILKKLVQSYRSKILRNQNRHTLFLFGSHNRHFSFTPYFVSGNEVTLLIGGIYLHYTCPIYTYITYKKREKGDNAVQNKYITYLITKLQIFMQIHILEKVI